MSRNTTARVIAAVASFATTFVILHGVVSLSEPHVGPQQVSQGTTATVAR